MNHWMFRCHDVSQKVSQAMDASLPLGHRLAIRFHLMMCRYCARFRRQLVMLRAMGRHIDAGAPPDDSTPASLSPEAKARIKKSLQSLS